MSGRRMKLVTWIFRLNSPNGGAGVWDMALVHHREASRSAGGVPTYLGTTTTPATETADNEMSS